MDSSAKAESLNVRTCSIKEVQTNHFWSFYLTVVIVVGTQTIVFKNSVLDPGSDLNLITRTTAEKVKALLINKKWTKMSGMAMRTADGTRHRLRQVTEVEFSVLQATWSQEFFVIPEENDVACGFSLLLGLPWRYDAWARLDISNFLYTI